ncbi:nucleolar RNA-binding Nop10p family protein [Nanoarchaeota archaeon]
MKKILKCPGCGKYTMKENCDCGCKTDSAKPVRYSADDKFGKYRRMAKQKK